jgi:hypothetical protein
MLDRNAAAASTVPMVANLAKVTPTFILPSTAVTTKKVHPLGVGKMACHPAVEATRHLMECLDEGGVVMQIRAGAKKWNREQWWQALLFVEGDELQLPLRRNVAVSDAAMIGTRSMHPYRLDDTSEKYCDECSFLCLWWYDSL